MNRIISRAGIMVILILVLLSGMIFFVAEYVLYSEDWVLSEGSPHVYTDYSTVCGIVTDRDGYVLLDTTDGRVYLGNSVLKKSIIHWLGDREGNIHAPILSYYAKELTGYSLVNGLYVYGNQGGVVTTTLSAQVQMVALEAMGDYKGTVAVYNYKTGELLCAVTTPTFDPDDLPDIAGDTQGVWEGAYINRLLRSTYIPGSIFKVVTTAAALETIDDIMTRTFTCDGVIEYGIDKVTCLRSHGQINLKEAFRSSCNCAYAQIAELLGGETLQRYAQILGVTDSIEFDGITTAAGNVQAEGEAAVMVAWSAIGQHKDQINPCQYMTLMGAIANGGKGAIPHVVASIDGGGWGSYVAQTSYTEQLISEDTARVLQELMRNNVETSYGDENFPGLTVCAKSGTAEVGGDLTPNAMFAGFVADDEYPLAFIVVVENGGYGRPTCVPILSVILEECKKVMDQE